MHVLFIFLDGVGLGDDDPDHNPFAVADLPTLTGFTDGHRWLGDAQRTETSRGTFIPTDARLGVAGRPQSATGQATILTGRNVPAEVGYHYGPKPDGPIAKIIRQDNLFKRLVGQGRTAALINAYPRRFFEGIEAGRRLPSAVTLAVREAGLPLFGAEALYQGRAMSADFTGESWRTQLGYEDAPLYTPREAGARLADLARRYDFAFFDHWPTDLIGHRGTLEQAVRHLEGLDAVMAGLLEAWDDEQGVIALSSDHGNIEDLGHRGHTLNLVPSLLVGDARHVIADSLLDLTGFAPGILRLFNGWTPAS
jgi:2,3-bisphosphoglycerate-independent phosphoglycerate mutase